MPSSRGLRVGVLLGERLVEERQFDGESPITFGQSWKCALSVPVDGVPREHVLFARHGERFVLRPLDGSPALPIERGARGKLRIGDATLLFQEIARPPAAPRMKLPASVRGTLADRVDRRLAIILGGSLLVHIAIAAWAWQSDLERPPLGLPTAQATYSQEVIDVIDDVTPAVPATLPGTAAPAPAPGRHLTPRTAPAPAPTLADGARLAAILTSSDDRERGPTGMSRRQPGADLDQQLREVRGHRVTIGDGGHVSRTDDHAHLGTATDALAIADPTSISHVPDHAPELPSRGRITLGPVKTDDGRTTLTPQLVLDKIQALYMAGLQRCYRKGLLGDAQLSGKLALVFTVDERGHVADPSATGVDPQVSACVTAQMSAWRFTEPRARDGSPTDATFQVSLVLRPD
ncbi:MAG TPA: AgmX/PglI C-terminal domain-containing protein [Kofleriaceae bacterium]|jgi:hypothetical protein